MCLRMSHLLSSPLCRYRLVKHVATEPSTPADPCHNRPVAGSAPQGSVAAHRVLEALESKLFQVEKGGHELHILRVVPRGKPPSSLFL